VRSRREALLPTDLELDRRRRLIRRQRQLRIEQHARLEDVAKRLREELQQAETAAGACVEAAVAGGQGAQQLAI
jgi:hypothetical protein